jgi:hypothetical protein
MKITTKEPTLADLIERAERLRFDVLAVAHYRSGYEDASVNVERAFQLLAQAQRELRIVRSKSGD